jgi:hypothetical protein
MGWGAWPRSTEWVADVASGLAPGMSEYVGVPRTPRALPHLGGRTTGNAVHRHEFRVLCQRI